MKTEDLQKIIKRYEIALSDNKIIYLDADEYAEIIHHYWEDNKYEETRRALSNALLIHPDNEELLRMQIEIFIDEGNLEKAREAMNNIPFNLSDEFQCLNVELYLEEGDRDTAIALLETLHEKSPDTETLVNMARLYGDLECLDKSFHCLDLAKKRNPKDFESSFYLLSALIDFGKHNDAIEICNDIIDKDPYSFPAWVKIAECYSALTQYDKAIEAAEYAIIISPDEVAPYAIRGHSYVYLENYDKALSDFYKVLELDLLPLCYTRFLIGFCQMNKKNYLLAIENFNSANQCITDEVDPNLRVHIALYTAFCLLIQEKYEEARSYIRTLIPAVDDPRALELLLNLIKKTPVKMNEWCSAILKDPSFQNFYNLAVACLENSYFVEAKEILLYLKELAPETEALGFNLLLACTGANDIETVNDNIDYMRNGLKLMDPENKIGLHDADVGSLMDKTNEILKGFFDEKKKKDEDGKDEDMINNSAN